MTKAEKSIYNKSWYQKNRAARIAYNELYKKENAQLQRNGHYKREYGISLIDYNEMLIAQRGLCAICGKPEENGNNLSVEHCHASGLVRSLACAKCNKALGLINDNPDAALAMFIYLQKHKEKTLSVSR